MLTHEIVDEFLYFTPSRNHLSETQNETLNAFSPEAQEGLLSMYRYIHTRKIIDDSLSSDERREFEKSLRSRMSTVDITSIDGIREHQELRLLHHCSVTADQAQLADAAFI